MSSAVTRGVFETGRRASRVPFTSARNGTHIQLRGVPRTAIPADIRRLWEKAGLNGSLISNVAIDYHRFLPSGSAWITLVDPAYLQHGVDALKKHFVGGLRVNPSISNPPTSLPSKYRGPKGRAEAAERGITTGNGPSGGIVSNGKNVVLSGLPGRMTAEGLKDFLKNFKLAGMNAGEKEIVKLEVPAGERSLTSRHLVRMASASEAHRLVRKLHHTFYEPDTWNTRYPIRARIIY